MFGPVVMEVPTMIAIVTVMLLRCGRFPSIPRLTMVELRCTMNPVHQHWHQRSATVVATILKQVSAMISSLAIFNGRVLD
jgi:hypothetical protein